MTRSTLAAVMGGILVVGCAVRPPTGPTVLAVPPEGKALSQFQQEEANCRNYAFNQIGITPTQAGDQSLAGSAVAGSAAGASNAQTSSYGLQARYDTAYTQCLASTGNKVQTAAAYASPYGYYGGYPYYSPYYGGYYGPGFYGPGLSMGLGFGFGRRHYFGGGGFRGGGFHGGGLRGYGIRGRR
jgi:hypothetical protein